MSLRENGSEGLNGDGAGGDTCSPSRKSFTVVSTSCIAKNSGILLSPPWPDNAQFAINIPAASASPSVIVRGNHMYYKG